MKKSIHIHLLFFLAGLTLGILLMFQIPRFLKAQSRQYHHPDYMQTALVKTGNPFDFAIYGRGYFEFTGPNGTTFYSRCSSFKMDSTRQIFSKEGYLLEPQISVPNDFLSFQIACEGNVSIVTPPSQMLQIGTIQLALFTNPDGLEPAGQGYFYETNNSGSAVIVNPGQDGAGYLVQGYRMLSSIPEGVTDVILVNGPYAEGVNDRIQEPLIHTGRDLDYGIEGRGFIAVTLPDGMTGYTRYLAFEYDNSSYEDFEGIIYRKFPLSTYPVGLELERRNIPPEKQPIHIFSNPERLHYFLSGIYQQTEESGPPQKVQQGENGAGVLKQGYLNQAPKLEP